MPNRKLDTQETKDCSKENQKVKQEFGEAFCKRTKQNQA